MASDKAPFGSSTSRDALARLVLVNQFTISNARVLAMLRRELVFLAVVLGLILCAFLMLGDTRRSARLPTVELHQLDIVV